jgi:hypothetical protein
MPPVITSIKPELRSKGLDRRQCCWHVSYRFCGLSAEITVYAENEAEARAKAVGQLRQRGLKVALAASAAHRFPPPWISLAARRMLRHRRCERVESYPCLDLIPTA